MSIGELGRGSFLNFVGCVYNEKVLRGKYFEWYVCLFFIFFGYKDRIFKFINN